MANYKSLLPKQRALTETETETSFNCWREAMIFHISLDVKTARFTSSGNLNTWTGGVNRGFTNDAAAVAEDIKMTAQAKAALLNIILGSVASYSPVISWAYITHEATSLEDIWSRLRAYYGFRRTGSKITEMMDIRLQPGESREALWERLYSFMESNLLVQNGSVKHEGEAVLLNEAFTPTILNMMVVIWLNIQHSNLPSMVRQQFATHLRDNTIYSIRSEISDAIPNLLAEKDGIISRSGDYSNSTSRSGGYNSSNSRYQQKSSFKKSRKKCSFCEVAGRPAEGHYLSYCPFLPAEDKKFLSKVRELIIEDDEGSYEEESPANTKRCSAEMVPHCVTRRAPVMSSAVLLASINSALCNLTLDSGAMSNMIRKSEVNRVGATILPTSQRAFMADGTTELPTVGETHLTVIRDHHKFQFSGLVVEDSGLDSPILAGVPFHHDNDVWVRHSASTIHLGDCCTIKFNPVKGGRSSNCKIKSYILKAPRRTCILPDEKILLPLPADLKSDDYVALEPRCMSMNDSPASWLQCSITSPAGESVEIKNSSKDVVVLEKHAQFCQVRSVVDQPEAQPDTGYPPPIPKKSVSTGLHSAAITVDPSNALSVDVQNRFHELHKEFDDVFSDKLGRYNGYSGAFRHIINMGSSLPPQRRGRVPFYNTENLDLLQQKFDDLVADGVLARPEDVGVSVEYVHPSFLVKKSSGGHRLVTSFGQVAEFAKPQPILNSNVDDVLLQIGQWIYIIKTDLKSSYYQIELYKGSMKYVGVVTPFRGTFVYTRSVMGLPGSEAAQEEILNRILGDLIQQGGVAKLADDLYIGANTIDDLLSRWSQVLHRLKLNGLKLSPAKTVCNPQSTIILGWLWEQGTLRASPHRLNALSVCTPPDTVKGLRSFIGVYKFLSRVLPFYADVLHPLEEACSSGKSADKIQWTDELTSCFEKSKQHLQKAQTVTLPRHDDQLHIVTDAATRCSGIASAMYVIRSGQPRLVGYFNAKRKPYQASWLPCEIEALSIGCGIRHFAPYLIQSKHTTRILTDSRPCILAYKKLCRGEFSASPRVSTFLSMITRFKVELLHIAGKENIFSDYMSRNPIACTGDCQVCDFVKKIEECVVGSMTVGDILSGSCRVPFTSRPAWFQVQQNCPDLSKVSQHLKDGISVTRKKSTNVRRYLNSNVKLSTTPNDKLLIVESSEPFKRPSQRIVIPVSVVDGLLTALHLQLKHPTKSQLKSVFLTAFFALDLDKLISRTIDACHTCATLKKIPARFHQQSTSDPPDTIGVKYSADVMRRYGQFVLLLRESISSYTDAVIISDELAVTLRDGLIRLASRFRSPISPTAIIRTDPATGLQALINDKVLQTHGLSVEVGEAKNVNKNPEAEKGIEELHAEITRLQPLGGKISDTTLAVAVSTLNSRIRFNHLSASEMWTQREMMSGKQLVVSDEELISSRLKQRKSNHQASAKYKARGDMTVHHPIIKVGDIVYVYSDRDKLKSREKYLVISVAEKDVTVQKFTENQLRAKQYHVKKSDVITVLSEPIHEPVPDEHLEDEDIPLQLDHVNPNLIPEDNQPEPVPEEPPQLLPEDNQPQPANHDHPDDEQLQPDQQNLQPAHGREARQRRRPAYLAEYVVDSE